MELSFVAIAVVAVASVAVSLFGLFRTRPGKLRVERSLREADAASSQLDAALDRFALELAASANDYRATLSAIPEPRLRRSVDLPSDLGERWVVLVNSAHKHQATRVSTTKFVLKTGAYGSLSHDDLVFVREIAAYEEFEDHGGDVLALGPYARRKGKPAPKLAALSEPLFGNDSGAIALAR